MVQIVHARRPLARKNTHAGLLALAPNQFEGYASLFDVADGAGDRVAPGAFAASLRRRGPGQVRMLYHTPRLRLGELVDGQELDAMTINDALIKLDALTDLYLKGQFINTPPVSPSDGDAYLLGASPSGAWSGYAYKIATCIDGLWRFFTPFDGLRAFVATSNAFILHQGGSWIDANALISGHEVSVASAATCDLGAAGSLFVAVTGATAITGLGTGANLLRFVRFAGALTLTHNATTLILPGAANFVTQAGDCAVFTSDAGGNWRCRGYTRAHGGAAVATGVTGSGSMVLSASPSFTGTISGAAQTLSGNLVAANLPAVGTWTPAIKFGGANGYSSYSRANGSYQRIGNFLLVTCDLEWLSASKTAATGSMTLAGLPAALTGACQYLEFPIYINGAPATNAQAIGLLAGGNTAFSPLYLGGGSWSGLSHADFAGNGQISFSFAYQAY